MGAGPDTATDEMLMVSYQRGDREAFASLVRRHETRVFNFIFRQTREPAAAEDITQDTFMRVVQNAAEFKHEARFATWLYTIARNLCIDHLRKARHRRHPSLDQPVASDGDDSRRVGDTVAAHHPSSNTERSAISSEVGKCIAQAVESLPEDQREVFLLREVANLPFKEIAEITGSGENTVKSRMRYALERLQQALSPFEEYARALR